MNSALQRACKLTLLPSDVVTVAAFKKFISKRRVATTLRSFFFFFCVHERFHIFVIISGAFE